MRPSASMRMSTRATSRQSRAQKVARAIFSIAFCSASVSFAGHS